MTPPKFTLITQSLGISLTGVSLGAAQALAEISKQPLPLIVRDGNRTRSNSKPLAVGPLVARELVALDREAGHYAATPKGNDYLTLLRHHNLLPS